MGRKIAVPLLAMWMLVGGVSQLWADVRPTRSFVIPMGELKYILINWLNQEQIEVKSHSTDMCQFDLTFRHNGKPWKIELLPQSAMATQVTLSADNSEPDTLKFEEKLWAFINSYLGPNQNDDEKELSEASIPDIIYSKTGAVVCINAKFNGLSSQFSGVIVDKTGIILCTAHDLKKFKTIKITDRDGKAYLGKVIKLDLDRDLALIKSQLKPSHYISLAVNRERLNKAETVYAIGCPMNQLGRITVGRVDEMPVKAGSLHYWQVSMETSPGSSGSPVFDTNGAIVGMVKGRYRGTNTTGFLIPIDRIRAFINEPEN